MNDDLEMTTVVQLMSIALPYAWARGWLTHCPVCGHHHQPGDSGVVDALGELIVAVCVGCHTRGGLYRDAEATARWLLSLTPGRDYINLIAPGSRAALVNWLVRLTEEQRPTAH